MLLNASYEPLQIIGLARAVNLLLADKAELLEEVADLFYHTLVFLASRDLSLADVEAELRRRHIRS